MHTKQSLTDQHSHLSTSTTRPGEYKTILSVTGLPTDGFTVYFTHRPAKWMCTSACPDLASSHPVDDACSWTADPNGGWD